MLKKKVIIMSVFVLCLLIGCFSPGDEATITLNFGGRNSRAGAGGPIPDMEGLDYTIVLTGPADTITLYHSGTGTITATVTPGNWNITVTAAYRELEPTAIYLFYNAEKAVAKGSQEAVIKSGHINTVTVNMTGDYPQSGSTQFSEDALEKIFTEDIQNSPGDFTISIGTPEIDQTLNVVLHPCQNITITSHSSDTATVRPRDDDEYLFSIPPGATLTLGGNITFIGKVDGEPTIKDNAHIKEN